ncbi:TRADD-N-associated membrane domain-containing protein [Rhodococcus sp. C26F]
MGSEAVLAADIGDSSVLWSVLVGSIGIVASTGLISSAFGFITQSRKQRTEEARQIDSLREAWWGTESLGTEGLKQAEVSSDQVDEVEAGGVPPDHVRDMRLRTSTSYKVLTDHYSNALSQSRMYAYLSYFVGLLGFIIMIVGVVMVYGGSLDSGILAAVVGAVVEGAAALVFSQARKAKGDSQQNLQLLADTVQQDNNRESALLLVALIEDPAERDRALADLARQAMASATAISRAPAATSEVNGGISTVVPSGPLPRSDVFPADRATA